MANAIQTVVAHANSVVLNLWILLTVVANAMVLLSSQKATAKVTAHSVAKYRATQTVKIVLSSFWKRTASIKSNAGMEGVRQGTSRCHIVMSVW